MLIAREVVKYRGTAEDAPVEGGVARCWGWGWGARPAAGKMIAAELVFQVRQVPTWRNRRVPVKGRIIRIAGGTYDLGKREGLVRETHDELASAFIV